MPPTWQGSGANARRNKVLKDRVSAKLCVIGFEKLKGCVDLSKDSFQNVCLVNDKSLLPYIERKEGCKSKHEYHFHTMK